MPSIRRCRSTCCNSYANYPSRSLRLSKRPRAKRPLTDVLAAARRNRYKVIHERNMLILALAKHAGFEAHLVSPAINKPGEDDKWRKVLCLHTPAKQLHWRLSPEDRADFKGLPTLRKSDWDGGKALDKAERLEQLHTLPSASAALREAVSVILQGFDAGVFVRSLDGDNEPMWALKIAPYIVALAKAQSLLTTDKP